MQVRGSDDTLEFADLEIIQKKMDINTEIQKIRNLYLEEKVKYIAQIVKVKQI